MKIHLAVVVSAALVMALVGPECTGRAVAEPSAAAPRATVAKVVFIDKEKACDCTKDRIAETWAELQTALKDRPGVPVERIHLDTEEQLAKPYQAKRQIMVPPAVYFMDERGEVLDFLQGELTADAIRKVLAPKASEG